MQTKQSLLTDVEALVLSSRFLSFDDKKKLMYKLPQLDEAQLTKLQAIFVQEVEEWKRIDDIERMAWNGLATSLNAVIA